MNPLRGCLWRRYLLFWTSSEELKETGDRTILLIEHKMDMILDLSDSVMVLYNGTLLADGTPEEIMKNETVQSAYLGGNFDERPTPSN